jgi:hypothetical protein
MNIRIASLVAVLAVAFGPHSQAANPQRMTSIEDALETSSASVTLPASTSGSLYFSDCAACNTNGLYLTDNSQYFIDGAQVPYAALQKLLGAKGPHALAIFHRPNDSAVTRILASS